MSESKVVCVEFSHKEGRMVAEIPVDDAAAFVAGVDSAMRMVSHNTGVPAWRMLIALNGTAMMVDEDVESLPVKGAREA